MNSRSLLLVVCAFVLIIACSKYQEEQYELRLDLPEENYDYVSDYVEFYNWNVFEFDNTPFDNPLTNAGATLGRVLFYDKRMSKSNLVSCASCHSQELAFADDKSFSTGFVNGDTKRNSMSIVNLSSKASFFWDHRVEHLEQQVLMPVTDHIEMGIEDLDELETKLNMIEYYPDLFFDAFGSHEITTEKVSKALAQFLRSMISRDAKYDNAFMTNFSEFTPKEKRGFEVFSQLPCMSCHQGSNLSGWGTANIGLDMEYSDPGISGWNEFMPPGNFAIPTLRNITKTAPYMHDGRFQTLREVLEHYAFGVQPHANLDGRLMPGGWQTFDEDLVDSSGGFGSPFRLNLTNDHIEDMIAFFHTLEDNELSSHERFSDPFYRE